MSNEDNLGDNRFSDEGCKYISRMYIPQLHTLRLSISTSLF